MDRVHRLLPPLRIHSWGGFGSQLFTAYVILKIQKRYPGRRIKVIVHTSGVTRRVSEFDFKILNVKVAQVEDFKDTKVDDNRKQSSRRNSSNFNKVLKHFLFRSLEQLRLILPADTDVSFNQVSFWTLALRGHYTRLSFDESLIKSLYLKLSKGNLKVNLKDREVVVHFRLGDLLHLTDKHPISVQRVESTLEKFQIHPNLPILLTDSKVEELSTFLKSSNYLKFSKSLNCDPHTTLNICIEAYQFLGTSAKLSLWAAIFRYYIFDTESYLPLELVWARESGLKAKWF